MEKHAGKRERMEESHESGRFCEEAEANPIKRLCKETNVDVVCEIMSKMDNEELGCLGPEEIGDEMVWDMMKMLEDEISPTPFGSDDTGISSNGCDELESSGDKDCSFNAEIDYLLGASDDELGIPCSPSVNDYDYACSPSVNDYDYDSCGFYECLEMQEAERQLLLQNWLEQGRSVLEQDENGIFSVHDLHIVSNQSEYGFCDG